MSDLVGHEVFWLAAAAVVATIAVVVDLFARHATAQKAELRRWQAVAIHRALQAKGAERGMSFDQLLQAYRIEATSIAHVSGNKAALTSDELRRVLMDLVTARVVGQRGNDNYALQLDHPPSEMFAQTMPDFGKSMAALMDQGLQGDAIRMMMGEQRTKKAAYSLISADPFRYTVAEIALKISSEGGMAGDEVRAFIFAAISRKELTVDQHQRVGLGDAPIISAGE